MFHIEYHVKVRTDLRKINKQDVQRILDMVDEKLALKPEVHGKPLRQTLKNIRSLRVGAYRVLYAIKKEKLIVFVIIVGKRDEVYTEAAKRLGGPR